MTLKGSQRLREELDHLKSVRRPEIIAAIAEARGHGDLKENAEYHAARASFLCRSWILSALAWCPELNVRFIKMPGIVAMLRCTSSR